jgi:uncharacterized phage-associated protein
MNFRFNLPRTVQAIAVLIREESDTGRVDYLRLLKLLYLADRRSIELYNRPITGDRIVAMDHGPVLSNVLNLINDGGECWSDFLETCGYNLCLRADPGDDDLSPAEVEILREVSQAFQRMRPWDIVNWTHQLPEWLKNHKEGTSMPIPLADILESVNRPSELDRVNDEAENLASIDSLLRSLD